MRKLIYKIKKRLFCYWCITLRNKLRFGRHYGRYPIDADVDEEGNGVAIYGNACMCKGHYWDYQNNEGIYDPYQ